MWYSGASFPCEHDAVRLEIYMKQPPIELEIRKKVCPLLLFDSPLCIPESIDKFTEDQAFSPSDDLALPSVSSTGDTQED